MASIGQLLHGHVSDYDFERGLGVVSDADTDSHYVFHCTAITDGTRWIDPGAAVCFRVGAAGPGHWEAVEIRSRDVTSN